MHPLKCYIGMFALCDIAIDCIVCMFAYICVTIVDAHKGPLMEINPILFYSSGANSNVTSVNNDVAAVKIKNRNMEKKTYSFLQFIRYRDLIWCSHGVPIGQSHRFDVCTTVQHKSDAT